MRRRARRGFTLVELLVALAAGLFVSAGAFSLAKAASQTFQRESRLANATMSGVLGFRRLVADLERASFLSTPNAQREYALGNAVCLKPGTPTTPVGIQNLAGIRIEAGSTYAPTGTKSAVDATNGLSPDRITIAGSMVSTEMFPIRSIIGAVGTQAQVFLNPLSGAATRTTQGDATVVPWAGNAQRQGVFLPGRIARIVDREGFQHFGVIAAADLASPGNPRVVLQAAPAIYLRENGPPSAQLNPVCKGIDVGTGATINMVNRVRYEVRDLTNVAAYSALYATAAPVAGVTLAKPKDEDGRFELVRSEIDAFDTVVAGSEELIAEYAIDLKFGGTVSASQTLGALPSQQLQAFEVGAGGLYNFTGVPSEAQAGPERLRALRVRFAVRSREADRAAKLTNPTLLGGQPGGLFRYQTLSGGFARVRTLQADVALVNHAGEFW